MQALGIQFFEPINEKAIGDNCEVCKKLQNGHPWPKPISMLHGLPHDVIQMIDPVESHSNDVVHKDGHWDHWAKSRIKDRERHENEQL
jgi:hypothetical protein